MNVVLEETLADVARFRWKLRAFSKLFEPLPAPVGKDAALVSLYLGIASLSSAGLLACAEGEIYAARAIARSLSEHFMRFASIVGGSAPMDFFADLQQAEAVEVDRRMRNCFPNEQIPSDIPAPLHAAIQATLIDPEPPAAERARAKEIVQKYQFDKLCKGLLGALKAHDGQDGSASYVTMALTYARFSACIHGGPSARDYIVSAPSAFVVASTASDLIAPWVSSLTLLLSILKGPSQPDAKAAVDLHRAFLRWVEGPRGPLGGLAQT